ncbi:hypothetical protein [Neomegalonema perideroedes]|uniref:hypothetical protein n=1 Tax=Neomegalonema perideroedes TaxID=217219 RepID=UPI0012FD39C8|nr:hypothetical protein [Neomegalonema perideroedes]
MGGTLALWYDERDKGTEMVRGAQRLLGLEEIGCVRPEVELHFNLWRDLNTSIETNFLDIGLRFRTSLEPVKQFYIYIPCKIHSEHLRDISQVLKFGQTLDAVFNSVISLGDQGDRYYKTTNAGRHFTTIYSIDFSVDGDVHVEYIQNDDQSTGSLIIFTEKLCGRIRKQQAEGCLNSYIRFRLYLKGPASEVFSQEIDVNDHFTVPLIGRLELTEFRLNEKRSYPSSIAEIARKGQFNVAQIHYFLIRDLRHELTMQHKPFRKVRRLEGKLWRHYLLDNGDERRVAEYERLADRMVIYHWREDAQDKSPVEDFVAFASFRASARNIWVYLLIAVLLGAVGSSLATGVANILKWRDYDVGPPGWEGWLMLIVLFGVAFGGLARLLAPPSLRLLRQIASWRRKIL